MANGQDISGGGDLVPDPSPQSSTAESNDPAVEKKDKRLKVIIIIVVIVTIVTGGGIYAWRNFFGDNADDKEETETGLGVDKEAEPDRELFDTEDEDIEEEEDGGDADEDEGESFPGMFEEGEYSSQHYVCDGAGGAADQYYFDLWYPTDYVTIHEGIGYAVADPDCDVELHYEDSVLYVRYNVNDDIQAQIEAGYEVLKEEGGKTMVRTETLENAGQYIFSYVWMMEDVDCVPSAEFPSLASPCAHGFHPFMPGTTLVQAVVPGDTGASVLGDIIDLFDDMAILMEGGAL